MKGGIGNLMKQAQQMQADLQKAQAELANLEVTGESGGGMVRVTMTGRHDVRRVEIDDTLFGDDKEMLEEERMSKFTSGLNLPPGVKLPF